MIRLARHKKVPVWAVFVEALVLGLVVSFFITHKTAPPPPYDPLVLPVQTVVSRVPGVNGPAVKLGSDLIVTGKKCNTSGHVLFITGGLSWVTIDPGGGIVAVGSGTNFFPAGCVTKTYANPMPAAVIAQTKQLNALGFKHVIWRLSGYTTPTGAVTHRWASQAFEVVP